MVTHKALKREHEMAKNNYFKARVLWEHAKKCSDKLDAPIEKLWDAEKISDDDASEKLAANDRKCGTTKSWALLKKAEDQVLDIGQKIVKTKNPELYDMVKPVYETKLISIREKVLDSTLRLALK